MAHISVAAPSAGKSTGLLHRVRSFLSWFLDAIVEARQLKADHEIRQILARRPASD